MGCKARSLDAVQRRACLSSDEVYRYELTRRWDPRRMVTWIMLNPSTADAEVDDPTIRRCMGFARRWGWGGIRVVNLYALRATNPAALLRHPDPEGPANEGALLVAVGHPDTAVVVAAWGAGVLWPLSPLIEKLRAWTETARRPLLCIGSTKDGHPRHPLYAKATEALRPWPEPPVPSVP